MLMTNNDLDVDFVASNRAKMNTTLNEYTSSTTEMEKTFEEKSHEETGEKTKRKRSRGRSKRGDQPQIDRADRYCRRNLAITGFKSETSIDELKSLCSQYGKVLKARVVAIRQKRHVQCYAFINMHQPEEAEKCIEFLDKTVINGRKIRVAKNRWSRKILEMRELKKLENAQKRQGKLNRKDAQKMFELSEKLSGKRMNTENENLLRYGQETHLEMENNNVYSHWREMLRSWDQSNPRQVEFWDEPTKSRMSNSYIPSSLEPPFQNQSCFNEYENTNYGRRVEHNKRRVGKVIEGSRFDRSKERQMMSEEMVPFRDFQDLLERRNDEWSRTEEKLKRLEELTRSVQRYLDRSKEDLWEASKRSSRGNYNNTSRFELPFQNESRYNEYDRTDYGRRVERYDRRDSRALEDGSHYDERKERETRPLQDFQGRIERRDDSYSRTDENRKRMAFDSRREPERIYIGPDQQQVTGSQNISACDRLGQMRNSLVGGPDQRSPWSSGSVDRKVDNWSHMHGGMDNSGMNQPNDRSLRKSMNTTGHGATGAFVDSSRPGNSGGGMGQNMGPGNMFGNSQSQGGFMMNRHSGGNFGGSNLSGRMQEPYFNAYNMRNKK